MKDGIGLVMADVDGLLFFTLYHHNVMCADVMNDVLVWIWIHIYMHLVQDVSNACDKRQEMNMRLWL